MNCPLAIFLHIFFSSGIFRFKDHGTAVDTVISVSYTHLDVYKRQHEYYGVKGIPITGVDTQRGLYMIWNKGDCLSPAAAAFITFMKNFSSEDFPRSLD